MLIEDSFLNVKGTSLVPQRRGKGKGEAPTGGRREQSLVVVIGYDFFFSLYITPLVSCR